MVVTRAPIKGKGAHTKKSLCSKGGVSCSGSGAFSHSQLQDERVQAGGGLVTFAGYHHIAGEDVENAFSGG
jgi:hypothetical protein